MNRPLPPGGPTLRLATGATATVSLVRGPGGGAWVEKRAHSAPDGVARAAVEREAHWLGELAHPNLVRFLGYASAGRPTLALEYLDGVSVAALLARSAAAQRERGRAPEGAPAPDLCPAAGPPFAPPLVARVAIEAIEAIAAVHRARADGTQLVHGDVNPRNIVITRAGRVVLCDFGAARPAGRGVPAGTAAYGPPEAYVDQFIEPGGDFFSLGVVLWEALRHERLFYHPSPAATLARLAARGVPPIDAGRPDLAPFAAPLAAALARDPARRPARAEQFAASIRAACAPAHAADLGALVARLAADEFARRDEFLAASADEG